MNGLLGRLERLERLYGGLEPTAAIRHAHELLVAEIEELIRRQGLTPEQVQECVEKVQAEFARIDPALEGGATGFGSRVPPPEQGHPPCATPKKDPGPTPKKDLSNGHVRQEKSGRRRP